MTAYNIQTEDEKGRQIHPILANTAKDGSGTWYVPLVDTDAHGQVDEAAVDCAAADVHAPAANTAAIVTYAAVADVKHVITGFTWSYVGGIPVGGNLKIEDVSGTTVFTMDISEEGAGVIVFPKPKKSAAVNTAMIVTLAAAGAAVTGKLSILSHFQEA